MDIENNNLLFVEIKHLIQTEDMDIWNYKNELTTLIDEAIARQSAKSEEIQVEINRLKKVLNQTKEAAKELKEQKYTVNMLPVYNQIKSLELQITALQEYQPWIPVSERLPEEYRFVLISIFNGKATGVGMIDKKKRWYGIYHQEMDITPEAWKPLPEPPKGE